MDNQKEKKTNVVAILGFIFSFLFALLGLILSIIGLNKSKELNSGRGLSIAGIIIAVINMVLGGILAATMAVTVPTVNNSIDKARETVVQNQSNSIEDWFEKEYSLARTNPDYASSEYNNYVLYNDFTTGEQELTEEVARQAGVISRELYTIDYNNSTVRLNNNRVCVKLVVSISGKQVEKYSTGCN